MSAAPWRSWNRHRASWRSGNATVEFALLAPLLMLLVVGLADFGLAVHDRMRLASAVRAGLQYAIHHSANPAQIEQAVLGAVGPLAASTTVSVAEGCECPDGTAVECDDTCPAGRRRAFVHVRAEQAHAVLLPWPGIETPAVLRAAASVRIQ